MILKLPPISISDEQLIWMQEVYSRLGKEELDIRSLKATLWGKLPRGFNPKGIDSRLLRYGIELTLLGVWSLDRENKWLEVTDKTIFAIRDMLLENPKRSKVTSEDLVEVTGISKEDVEIALTFVMQLGRFWSSASGSDTAGGHSQLSFNGLEYFDEYLNYDGIVSLLKKFYGEAQPTERTHWPANPITPSPNLEPQYSCDVFLSYSSFDRQEALSIYESVKGAGGEIFLSEKSLEPGDEFDERIRDNLVASGELWLLVSPNSLKSEWVHTEWGAAWALRKKIVPILFRCKPEDLPDRMRRKQCIDFHNFRDLIKSRYS